jgi:hypothetical protein
MESLQGRFAELLEITDGIAIAAEVLVAKLTDRTAEMVALPKDAKGNTSPKEAKRIVTKVAADLDQYTAQIEAALHLYDVAMQPWMKSFSKDATTTVAFDRDSSAVRPGLDAVIKIRNTLAESRQSTVENRETIASLPRMTITLNKAKRGTVAAIDRLLAEFAKIDTLVSETEKDIRALLDE